MKRLDRLLVKSFLGPFAMTFAIAIFVLLMQFIWKYVDDIAGKGLPLDIIMKLLVDASATMVPMAMPIAVLFASIMTMGNLGERYELIAIKAGGVPVWRAMMPLTFIVMILTVVAFLFSNYVMPPAVLKYRTTLYDITRKKPAISIQPGEYYSEIDGYVIRIDEKDRDGKTMHGVTVYDHRSNVDQPDVVVAERGIMQTTPDEHYLVFSLENGCSYHEEVNGDKLESRPLTRIWFEHNEMTFDISEFAFSKSDESMFKGGYQMMSLGQLDSNIVRLQASREEEYQRHKTVLKVRENMPALQPDAAPRGYIKDYMAELNVMEQNKVWRLAEARAEQHLRDAETNITVSTATMEYLNRHHIEWHRKFTLSVACLVLFLVGAPFGSVVRKGGLGLPMVASVLFFVLYYVVGMIAEKAVRGGVIGNWGMWISTFVMLPIGLFLTWRTMRH